MTGDYFSLSGEEFQGALYQGQPEAQGNVHIITEFWASSPFWKVQEIIVLQTMKVYKAA